jgi:Ca2+ transporting ATPase
LKNLGPNDIEEDPELMNSNKEQYIQKLLTNQPKAITGNSFYNVIGGLICDVCKSDTNLCKCPKTESQAKTMAENDEKKEVKPIKKDAIKNIENFKKITENLKVMARSQPIHKYALVLGLKSLKNVVAVTGDGTNDAPALSKSDVGFAMFAGTDIAKQASDIIIIDNNFSSIVIAIIYGRNIYDNIRKFLQFQLSVNFCACILVFVCACIGNETPLTPIQMLWVNLIMDSLGSLALATEPPYDELLDRKPTKRNESIINGRMWKHIIMQSLIQIILLIALYLWAPYFIEEDNIVRLTENRIIKYCYTAYPGEDPKYIIHGTKAKWESSNGKLIGNKKENCGKYMNSLNLDIAYDEYINANDSTTHMTLIFNIFVYYTLFNQINCRVIDDSFNIFVRIHRSFLFILICLAEMCLQLLIIFIGKSPFHIINQGLTGKQWGICIGFSAITFVVSFITKLIPIHNCIDNLLKSEEIEEKEEKEKNEQEQEKKNIETEKVYIEKKKIIIEENDALEPDNKKEKKEKAQLMSLGENNLETQRGKKKKTKI